VRVFKDRRDAGIQLAHELQRVAEASDVVVLALPRGGVPIGYEIATRLGVPLDVLIVRKLGVPQHPELAMGAIASGGVELLNRELVDRLRIGEDEIEDVVHAERRELARREQLYRGVRGTYDVSRRTALLVDDGLATGSTMVAAVAAVRARDPARVVVAVPVAAPQACEMLRAHADDVICLLTPQHLYAVSTWYEDFGQTSDEEVRELLVAAERQLPSALGDPRRGRQPSRELRLR